MDEPTVRLMLGDCLDRMAEVADGSVDLVACDLPYGTTACKWDVVIPLVPLWAHYRRILKPAGSVVLTSSQPFTSALVMSNPGWFKYCLVAEKSSATGFLDAAFRPLKAHDDVAVFSPAGCSNGSDPAMTYRPRMGAGDAYRKSDLGRVGLASSRGLVSRRPRDSAGARWPRSVLYFRSPADGLHPTQKPVALMDYLVCTYADEGATVLDNAMGSGTTGVACRRTGRHFIGIERDAGYFATAERRIAAALRPESRLDPRPARAPLAGQMDLFD